MIMRAENAPICSCCMLACASRSSKLLSDAISGWSIVIFMQDADFRPTSVDVNATAQAVSLVLCNDKPTTFGAPDVLDFCADKLELSFDYPL